MVHETNCELFAMNYSQFEGLITEIGNYVSEWLNDTKLADCLCNKPKIVQLYHAAIFYSFFYEVIFYFLIGNNQSSILEFFWVIFNIFKYFTMFF